MSGYQIRRRFSHHAGGTKAYQIWEVQHDAAVVVVFQFGSFTMGRDEVRMGGTIDVQDAANQSTAQALADKKQREKSKRGYQEWTVETCPLGTLKDFHDVLKTAFGGRKFETIVAKLDSFNESSIASKPEPEVDPENDDEGDTKAPVIEIEQASPEWGSW
jgi:predicted DNA-binding WGR domain protein